ncbi:MAG: FAD:protein FMN transferase [Deltaproteobacteria bacterium]|nr:FAD:protein FMN transferase [Deltaproteobacteria bacterium]
MNNINENKRINRRSFLKLSGLLGVSTMASTIMPVKPAEAFLFNRKEYKISEMRLAMGTFVSITAIHKSRSQAEDAFAQAFEEINRLTSILSRFQEESPVYELNSTGKIKGIPKELKDVLIDAQALYRRSYGAFDITVKPIIDLYKECSDRGYDPDSNQIANVLQRVGGSYLKLDGNSLYFTRSNMGITLDGIAKGYIVDKVSYILKKNGIKNHLINAGGDIRTSGTAANGKKWTIAIQDPHKQRRYPDLIHMNNGAVATSGNYEVYYDKQKVFHHITNPRTGLSPQQSVSVSVMAPTVQKADALSTTVFVLEPQKGINFINSQPECECFIIEHNGIIKRSSGWIG